MSLVPLPINSPRSLPLSSEGLTVTRMVNDPLHGSEHPVIADLHDFADIMGHIAHGVPAPTYSQATECCSASEGQAVSEKTLAADDDLPMDGKTSPVDGMRVAATSAEASGFAIQAAPPGDETGVRSPALQPVATDADPAKLPFPQLNPTETAGSETHLRASGPIAAGGQTGDGDTPSAWPAGMTTRDGGATKVKDRVISLQEFTLVAGALRTGLTATTQNAATQTTNTAVFAPGTEVEGLPHKGRDMSSRPKTGTESAQNPHVITLAAPTGSEGLFSRTLSLRDAAVQSQEMVLPEPETMPSAHGAAGPLTGKTDPLRPANNALFAGPVVSGDPAPISAASEDLDRIARPAESPALSIQTEGALVNGLNAATRDMSLPQGWQNIASFAMNPLGHTLAFDPGWIESQATEELAEGVTASAINTASAALRPEGVMPRIDLPRHVAQQIADVVTRAADGPVDLHLNPDELGKVRISMAMVEGGITVTILAERPDTLDLMRRHIDQLAQEFRQLGYGLINFSFGQRNEGHENRSHGDRDPAGSAGPEDTPRIILVDSGHGQENGLDMRI